MPRQALPVGAACRYSCLSPPASCLSGRSLYLVDYTRGMWREHLPQDPISGERYVPCGVPGCNSTSSEYLCLTSSLEPFLALLVKGIDGRDHPLVSAVRKCNCCRRRSFDCDIGVIEKLQAASPLMLSYLPFSVNAATGVCGNSRVILDTGARGTVHMLYSCLGQCDSEAARQ